MKNQESILSVNYIIYCQNQGFHSVYFIIQGTIFQALYKKLTENNLSTGTNYNCMTQSLPWSACIYSICQKKKNILTQDECSSPCLRKLTNELYPGPLNPVQRSLNPILSNIHFITSSHLFLGFSVYYNRHISHHT
jgi:hypothetical protein